MGDNETEDVRLLPQKCTCRHCNKFCMRENKKSISRTCRVGFGDETLFEPVECESDVCQPCYSKDVFECDSSLDLRWFGYSEDLTRHLIEYIPHPRTLYHLSMTNKLVRSLITTEILIKCAMYHGGRSFATIFKLTRLMNLEAIYPPSAMRINLLLNERLCEFCFNVKVKKRCREIID